MFFNLICSLTVHEKASDSACKHETLCNHFKTNVFFDDFVFFNQQLQHLLALEVLFLHFQISYLFMAIKLMTLDMLSECSTVEPHNHLPIAWIFFYHEWVLSLVKYIPYISCNDPVGFLLYIVDVKSLISLVFTF